MEIHRACVERDVEVEIHLQLPLCALDLEVSQQAKIQLVEPIPVQRARRDHLNGGSGHVPGEQTAERRADRGDRRRPRGKNLRTRQALKRAAHLEIQGQRVRAEELDLREERWRDLTELQLLRRVHHKAGISHASTRVESAGEQQAAPESGVDGDIEPVVNFALCSVVTCERPQVVRRRGEFRRRDIIQPTHLITAAAGQPWIHRRSDAVRIVIGGCP